MKHRTWIPLTLAICLLASAGFAQEEDVEEAPYPRWQEASIMGGLFIDDTAHANISGAYLIGLRRHFGIEFDVSSSFPSAGNVTSLTANVELPFEAGPGRFTGYVAGGAGVTRNSVDLGERERILEEHGIAIDAIAWDATFDAGLGAKIKLTDSGLYWRADYRYYYMALAKHGLRDDYHRFVMGFTARF